MLFCDNKKWPLVDSATQMIHWWVMVVIIVNWMRFFVARDVDNLGGGDRLFELRYTSVGSSEWLTISSLSLSLDASAIAEGCTSNRLR